MFMCTSEGWKKREREREDIQTNLIPKKMTDFTLKNEFLFCFNSAAIKIENFKVILTSQNVLDGSYAAAAALISLPKLF